MARTNEGRRGFVSGARLEASLFEVFMRRFSILKFEKLPCRLVLGEAGRQVHIGCILSSEAFSRSSVQLSLFPR